MQALLDVILPVFVIIGFGYVAAWRGLFNESAVEGVMRFAQNFAVPVLLFKSISGLDLAASWDPRILVSFYTGAFLSFGLGFAGAIWLFRRPATDAVAIGFCCLFSNSLLMGIPITERAYGTEALAGNFAIISVHSPLLYGFGITLMEIVRNHGRGTGPGRVALAALAGIARTPLVIGIAAGLAVNLTGLPVPGVVGAAVAMMASAALPAALFGLGGVLLRYRPEGDFRTIAMVCVLSLVLHPAVAYATGRWGLGLDTAGMRSSVVTASMAPGVNAYLFANMYGAARRVAASSVLIATALSAFTIWAWLAILP